MAKRKATNQVSFKYCQDCKHYVPTDTMNYPVYVGNKEYTTVGDCMSKEQPTKSYYSCKDGE